MEFRFKTTRSLHLIIRRTILHFKQTPIVPVCVNVKRLFLVLSHVLILILLNLTINLKRNLSCFLSHNKNLTKWRNNNKKCFLKTINYKFSILNKEISTTCDLLLVMQSFIMGKLPYKQFIELIHDTYKFYPSIVP